MDSTAATFTVTSATPKRVSARLSLTLEDIAAVGQANFEQRSSGKFEPDFERPTGRNRPSMGTALRPTCMASSTG